DKLFASVRMLALAKPGEFLFAHLGCQSIFGGQTSLPFTLNSIASGPIALLFRSELLLVIALRLSCREWLRNCQHAFNSLFHQSLGPRLQRCAQEPERALAQAWVPVVPASSERSGHPWGAPRIQGASLQGRRTETRIVPRGCRISGNPGDRRDQRFLRASRGAPFGDPERNSFLPVYPRNAFLEAAQFQFLQWLR